MAVLVEIISETRYPNENVSFDLYENEVSEEWEVETVVEQSIVFDSDAEADAFIKEFGNPVIPLADTNPDVTARYTTRKTDLLVNTYFKVMYEVFPSTGTRPLQAEANLLSEDRLSSPEIRMAMENHGKAFALVDGKVVEMSEHNPCELDSATTYWTAGVDRIEGI